MVETRKEADPDVDPDALRQRVVAIGMSWSLAQYALVTLVAALDASGEWTRDGAPTCAHWVGDALDIEVCTAREWLRIAEGARRFADDRRGVQPPADAASSGAGRTFLSSTM